MLNIKFRTNAHYPMKYLLYVVLTVYTCCSRNVILIYYLPKAAIELINVIAILRSRSPPRANAQMLDPPLPGATPRAKTPSSWEGCLVISWVNTKAI